MLALETEIAASAAQETEQAFETQTSITSERTLNFFQNRLSTVNPLERKKTTLVSSDSVEYLNHKQYIAMKFKSSYMAY